MSQGRNHPLGANKFYNIQKGKKDNHFFFVLPSLIVSPKKFLHWDIMMFSIFLGWGKYYIQFNVFETVKDISTEVLKNNMADLLSILRASELTLSPDPKSMNIALDFLNKNPFLVSILKNGNVNHPYVKSIISSYFQNQSFITEK